MAIYTQGGWVGCGDYLTILATSRDRSVQIVRREHEADGYHHPDMVPHGSAHTAEIEYRLCRLGGETTISASTARRWVRKITTACSGR